MALRRITKSTLYTANNSYNRLRGSIRKKGKKAALKSLGTEVMKVGTEIMVGQQVGRHAGAAWGHLAQREVRRSWDTQFRNRSDAARKAARKRRRVRGKFA